MRIWTTMFHIRTFFYLYAVASNGTGNKINRQTVKAGHDIFTGKIGKNDDLYLTIFTLKENNGAQTLKKETT